MRRAPRVVIPEDRHDSSMVSEILSSMYSTVVPASLRGLAGSTELAVEPPRHCEVTCCDVLDNRIALGFASAGFSVWYVSSPITKATEIICETEGSPVRLVRLVPRFLSDPTSAAKGKNPGSGTASPSSSVMYDDAWGGDITLSGGKPAGLEAPDLLYVEAKEDHVVKVISLQSGRLVDELGFESRVVDVRASGRFVGIMLRDHSARVYVRNDACKLSESPRIISLAHAHPLVLGSRWAAFGANSGFEARHEAKYSSSHHPQHQEPQQVLVPSVLWQDLTKQLAASAFKLGEAGSKRLTEYLSPSNGGGGGAPASSGVEAHSPHSSEEEAACACDVIVVRDLLADRPVCRIQSASSFLHFDESGALLVSAVRDGQSIHVYSLPRGTLLYKLERGLRPARIVSAGFSPDRRWLAVASSRGTTHVFAVDPSGAKPSMLTHGQNHPPLNPQTASTSSSLSSWLISSSSSASSAAAASIPSAAMASGGGGGGQALLSSSPQLSIGSSPKLEPRYMREQQQLVAGGAVHNVSSSGSLGKVTASQVPPRQVVFSPLGELRIISGRGLVEDYSLRAVGAVEVGVPSLDGGGDRLHSAASTVGSAGLSALEVLPLRSMGLMRDVKESVMPATPFANGTTTGTAKNAIKSSDSLADMMSFDVSVSNFEPQPSLEPLVPVWASPQLLLVQTATNVKSDVSSLFYSPQGTVLQVRSSTPPPGLASAMRTPAFPVEAAAAPAPSAASAAAGRSRGSNDS